MKQIMINLLTNAVKFTQTGGVTVSIKKKEEIVRISIEDTGIGIKEEDHSKIFTEFCTINSHQELNPNGTGLGLYLCKKFVQLMNGSIKMKSVYGKGTKFTVKIPLSSEDDMPSRNIPKENLKTTDCIGTIKNPFAIEQKHLKFSSDIVLTQERLRINNRNTVLVVDDNPMNSFVICRMVNKYSFNSEKAVNGKEAIKLVQDNKNNYCLIFMDINMPIMSGPEVFFEIILGCTETQRNDE